MTRVWWLAAAFAVLLAGCGFGDDAGDDDETDVTPAPAEIEIGEDGEPVETTTTLPPDDEESTGEDEEGPLRVATLLPIESGSHQGEHWFKWKLGEPIADPVEEYVRAYQLTIRSLEDDLFGIAYTIPQDEDPFAVGFCLEDRPNCADPEVPVGVEVGSDRDVLIFRVPEGSFGAATGLDMSAHIMTFPEEDSDPQNEFIADGASDPVRLEEKDPC